MEKHSADINEDTPASELNTSDQKAIVIYKKTARFALFIAFIALFFTAVGIAAGYKNWLRIHDKAKLALVEIDNLKQQQTHYAQQDNLKALTKKFEHYSQQQNVNQQQTLDRLSTLTQEAKLATQQVEEQLNQLSYHQLPALSVTPASDQQRLLIEARYLINLATINQTLKTQQSLVIYLLQEADKRLLELNSPVLLPARAQLKKDIVQLSAKQTPNIEGLLAHIALFENSLKHYQTTTQKTSTQKTPWFKTDTKQQSGLEHSIKTYLNTKISRRDQLSELNLLPLAEQKQLYQLLQLQLASLRQALLLGYNEHYNHLIKNLRFTINTYLSEKNTANHQQSASHDSPALNHPVSQHDIKQWLDWLTQLDQFSSPKKAINLNTTLSLLDKLTRQHIDKQTAVNSNPL